MLTQIVEATDALFKVLNKIEMKNVRDAWYGTIVKRLMKDMDMDARRTLLEELGDEL